MAIIFIDDKKIEAPDGATIFQAAQSVGISIPHFCYHPAFKPEGTCRMCLVEIEGMPKLELACSTVVREGMKISTQSEAVREARRGVLEFLLAEHPLDCPICDQAGDCKLQDYYEEYGLYDSRFQEAKDKHTKKVPLGNKLLHDQERCVLCRRCVRFLREVTGTGEMGVFERGGHTEVNVYAGRKVNNNYSGNLAQLCPVGAITDTDFRFQTRSWFLVSKESICPLCGRGCRISIQSHRGFSRFKLPKRVYRIQAVDNPQVNGPWICDLGRYEYSYLDEGRASRIIMRGEAHPEWEAALSWLSDQILSLKYRNRLERISVVLNTFLSNEELFLAKKIFHDDLGVKKIFFAGPEAGQADDLLLTAERSPNRRGAVELGWDITPVDLEGLAERTELLIIFGSFFEERFSFSDIAGCLERIDKNVLICAKQGKLETLVDLMLPSAFIAEKSGSLTNIEGIVQHFSPALSPLGQSRSEFEILTQLGKSLALNFPLYGRMASPQNAFGEMRSEIQFFENDGE